LQPFEESAAIYFSLNLKRETKNVPDEVAHTFLLATRVIVTFSLFILAFGSCYAKLVAQLYGGALFIENQGSSYPIQSIANPYMKWGGRLAWSILFTHLHDHFFWGNCLVPESNY